MRGNHEIRVRSVEEANGGSQAQAFATNGHVTPVRGITSLLR